MQITHLRIISRLFLTGLIFSMPLSGSANSDREFPYHMDKTIEKQKTYDYAFESVWDTAMTVLKEMEKDKLRNLREAGLNEVKTSIEGDRSSGLIKFKLTHKGEKGLLSEKRSLFFYQVLLIEPLEKQRTRAYTHEINLLSYDSYVFHRNQLARYVDVTPPERNILEEILIRLRERSVENR